MSADGDIVRGWMRARYGNRAFETTYDDALAALARLEAAEAILHPQDEEHLGQLIAALRAQVELDEGGYCVLCGMHYTDPETLEHDRKHATAMDAKARRAEAQRDALAEALREIAAPASIDADATPLRTIARAALAEAGLE